MTSEICVMNRMSVVLAADSASTISYYDNGEQQQRYFKGANKVFQLSDAHPVGLMIYGNAEIMGVPWELVIKAFRRHLGNGSHDTIEGYARAFQQFIDDSQQLFPSAEREQSFNDAIELQTAIWCRDFNNAAETDEGFDEPAQVAQLHQKVDAMEFENGLDEEFLADLLHNRPTEILQSLKSEANEFYHPLLGDRSDDQLLEVIKLTIKLKAKKLPDSPTGLVFAGYGEASVYPEAFVSKDTGFVAGQLVMANIDTTRISHRRHSYISGFAQSSMAETFIIGFDAQAYETILATQRQSMPEVLAPFVAELGAAVERTPQGAVLRDKDGNIVIDEERFAKIAFEAVHPIGGKIMHESHQKHGEPLERVISMLPVEEMAELAATMVDLQSLKEKVTRPSETVGGPVDVAIITKNEGLVWKKRKHFFDVGINQRYLQRLHTQD